MNILMISGDKRIFEKGTDSHSRLALQASQVKRLDVFVWPQVHSSRTVMRAAYKRHYDVVTAQDPFWRGFLAFFAARVARARLNIQVHADIHSLSLVRRMLARFTFQHADSIRVVSNKIAEELRQTDIRAQIYVLPVYVDLNKFHAVARRKHNDKVILWMGRFEPEKDPLEAIRVLRLVQEKGINARLIMLGSGTLESAIRKAASDLPQTQNGLESIILPGWQEPTQYLAEADVVLSTSYSESWGASIIEALAAGVPVVAPDVGIAREAGAIIADRNYLASSVINVLERGTRGVLNIALPSAEEWAKRWRETLV